MLYVKCGGQSFEFERKVLAKHCQLCKGPPAIVSLSTQKLKLCQSCFERILEKRVLEGVKTFKMFKKHHRIGLCLSGGKDSASLAHLLKKIFPDTQFLGIYIDLGIGYYSDQARRAVEAICERLSIPLYVYDLREKDGISVDDFLFTNFRDKICSVCGTIKRHLFSKVARELGLNVLATGHHLDDLVSTYLQLFLAGDFESIKRLAPYSPPLFEGQAVKVKPLYQIPEIELYYYAVLNDLPLESCGCPHGEITPIKRTKNLLEELSKENRNIKFQLLSVFLNKFIPLLRENQKEDSGFLPCLKCGEPTVSPNRICGFCRRKELVERIEERKLELTPEEWDTIPAEEKANNWVIFDLRDKDSFEKGALTGARNLPIESLDNFERYLKVFKSYRNKNILLYCYTGRLSYRMTLFLCKHGFRAFNLRNPEKVLSN